MLAEIHEKMYNFTTETLLEIGRGRAASALSIEEKLTEGIDAMIEDYVSTSGVSDINEDHSPLVE